MSKNSASDANKIGIITHGQACKASNKPLGQRELIAIAVGGMIGGGIFSVLGVAVAKIGYHTLYALLLGGVLALLSVYSYAKLTKYYKDEGATYSFFKRTYPNSHTSASVIGWIVVFGYISTLALYADTFGSYLMSALGMPNNLNAKLAATGILLLFTFINLVSVRGMGIVEDLLVYAKLVGIIIISLLFLLHPHHNILPQLRSFGSVSAIDILSVAALTYVAYEGFQLAINAYKDADRPSTTISRAMFLSVAIVTIAYIILAFGTLSSLPLSSIIRGKEFALAAGAKSAIGIMGYNLVILAALFATTSALSGTLYGASRLLSVIASDGYMPATLARRSKSGIPRASVLAMALVAFLLLISGTLQKILEFGSFTFMLSSLLIAVACFKIRRKVNASGFILVLSIVGLGGGLVLLTLFQFSNEPQTLYYTFGIYAILGLLTYYYKYQAEKKSVKSLH